MSKTIMFLVICLFCSSGLVLADSWHIEILDTTGYVGEDTSIALDSSDYPHISYYDYTNGDLKYAYWTGSTWSITSVDTAGIVGMFTSIALDSLDYPHISYVDYSNIHLKYAYWTGSAWSITSVDTAEYTGAYSSIAIDSSGFPHISYCDDTNYDLKYAYWTGSTWSITSVDTAGIVGMFTSIALDSLDYPHISYFDQTNSGLKYAYWTGSAWSITSVDTTGFVGEDTSIALDSSDYPHISYHDYNNGYLKYARWTGSTWSITSVDTGGGWTSIALDSSDYPHISYFDGFNEDLKYAFWNGSAWSITSVDTNGRVGLYTSIALDSGDKPHISYCDGTHSNLKYAWYGPNPSISLLSFTATPQEDSSVLLNWQVETTGGEQIAGFNLYRREITPNPVAEGFIASPERSAPPQNKNDWTQINSSLITGKNPYAYTDGNVQGGITYEYKLEAVLADETAETLGTASCAPTPPAFAIVSLYPNPVTDNLNISITDSISGEMKVKLYDLSGRLVMEQNYPIESGSCEVTISLESLNLKSGLYTVKLEAPQLSKTSRIVYIPENK